MRGDLPSKILLLLRVIGVENSANNGGTLTVLLPLIGFVTRGPATESHLLEDQNMLR